MRWWFGLYVGLVLNCVIRVTSESYYSIIAPGVIKSNHNYMAIVSLHEAKEPAKINLRIQGPFYYMAKDIFLKPNETIAVVFVVQKLARGEHKLVAEGISGITFRNETKLIEYETAGPKIYIQTDKAVYKPGDEVQFRVVMLDVHTRPLKIQEPIRVEILDGAGNRVKQYKDIALIKGVYKNKFQLSEHPVVGSWEIRVSISGKYDYSIKKEIKIRKYVLPKFSVYIKTDTDILRDSRDLKVLVYGKYTFDKYVEGNVTLRLIDHIRDTVVQEKQLLIKDMLPVEFHFDDPKTLSKVYLLRLVVDLTEKHTGVNQSSQESILLRDEPYHIVLDPDKIEFRDSTPYRLKVALMYWNGAPVLDHSTPVIMEHGGKEYQAYLDTSGEATFDFEHDKTGNHIFRYRNLTHKVPNIYMDERLINNSTESYCKLTQKGDRPRLGAPVEIEITSIGDIPYLIYAIVGHSSIIQTDRIVLEPNQKSYTLQITPSIEMVPYAFVYVHYVENGNFRYDELKLTFPLEFENKVMVTAPKQVKPGQSVTLELKAQPKSYVGVLAVDLGVYLLDSSYDLKKWDILNALKSDVSRIALNALVYPGILSGVVTLTNAHYPFVPLDARSVASPAAVGPLIFRKKFPETWIFENYQITNETTRLTLDIPDTITTWRVTAFSVHERTGFGIVDGPTDITTIQDFFISLNLPYSVKRGEIVAIPILVHNYHTQSLDSEITLFNEEGEFYFVESSLITGDTGGTEEQQRTKRVTVPANGVESVSFLINPKQVGDLSLRVTATNPISSDAVIQKLKVEPEGTPKRHTKSLYVNVPTGETIKATFPLHIPPDIVPNSEFITLSVGGDHLVPTLKNLNSLVLLPTGCGEQNMVNFAPNILVLDYLKASGKYFKERALVSKAKKYIDVGYQQQLSYRHSNGGYSVFGARKDEEPSTWLTAYVIRFFIKATKYLAIENHIVDSGLDYLAGAQLADGGFPYTGYLFYPAQQNRYGFTAFVLMSFLEDQKYAIKYESVIQKGLKFLDSNLDKVTDIYALSIVATTFQMVKHANAQKLLDKLKLQKMAANDFVWWSQSDRNREKDVEITAYALMALLEGNSDPQEDLSIVKWLTEQRNEHGGFKSTHDTVVGLQALVKYSNKYEKADNMNLKIQYSAKNNESLELKRGELSVDGQNLLILQTEEFPISTRSIDIQAYGVGRSLLQVSYQYHVSANESFKHFHIQPKPKFLNSEELLLEICFTYQHPNQAKESLATNMIIMEANLPSGFTSADEYGSDLLENEIVDRVESKNSETTVIVYFEKLTANVENCLNILSDKIHDVVMRKPAAISVYDFYNISRHDTAFYSV